MDRIYSRGWLASVMACLAIAGCGSKDEAPKVAPAGGTVTYQGKPVTGATVTFVTEGAPKVGVGITDAQGKFQIGTFTANDGAIIGEHKVVVAKVASAGAGGTMSPDDYMKKMASGGSSAKIPGSDAKNELPTKYSSQATTDLKASVKAGDANNFTFELKD